jgi:hypothetical protein
MDRLVELLTVADHFQIERFGLIVVPHFAVPGGWNPRLERVVIVTPDGESRELTARLTVAHLNISDPARANERWSLVVSFPAAGKHDVPIGSKVMVSQSLRAEIQAAQISN